MIETYSVSCQSSDVNKRRPLENVSSRKHNLHLHAKRNAATRMKKVVVVKELMVEELATFRL